MRSKETLTAICSPSARESEDLVACRPTGIEVEAPVGEGAHNERGILLVVVDSLCNNIPKLALRVVASLDLHRNKVLPEITSSRGYLEALTS